MMMIFSPIFKPAYRRQLSDDVLLIKILAWPCSTIPERTILFVNGTQPTYPFVSKCTFLDGCSWLCSAVNCPFCLLCYNFSRRVPVIGGLGSTSRRQKAIGWRFVQSRYAVRARRGQPGVGVPTEAYQLQALFAENPGDLCVERTHWGGLSVENFYWFLKAIVAVESRWRGRRRRSPRHAPRSGFLNRVSPRRSLSSSGIGELVLDLSGKVKTLSYPVGDHCKLQCVGRIRIQVSSTITRKSWMCDASREGFD